MLSFQTKLIEPSNYFPNWQNSRIDYIVNQFGENFFKNKSVLELASCNGYIGNYFSQVLGANVTVVEGRDSNIEAIRKDYPNLKLIESNLDKNSWDFDYYDIIINWGLFYHLQFFHKEHLENCIDHCGVLLFESVIFDSDESEIFFRSEKGNDQSLSRVGGTPSTSYVEDIFKNKDCKFLKSSSSKLNGDIHIYDWKDSNGKKYHESKRRFWTVFTNKFNLNEQ